MSDENAQPQTSEITTIAREAGTVFLGTIIGTGLKYIFELIVARSLGPEPFGLFFLGFTLFKVLERTSTLGLHNGVLRYVSLYRGERDKTKIKGTILFSIKIVLIVGSLIAAFIIIFADIISVRIFHQVNFPWPLRIFAIAGIFTAVTEILVYSTQAFQITKYKVLVRMLFEPGLRIFLVLITFLLGWKLWGAVFAFASSIILGTFLAVHYVKKIFPPIAERKIKSVYDAQSILSFSWPLFFVGFFNLFMLRINTLMLGYFRTSGEVGVYGAAQRTAFLMLIILHSFNAIFAPMIADLYHRGRFKKLENTFKIVSKWVFATSLPLFLILLFFAKEILSLWGKGYTGGVTCLIIISLAQLINCSVGSVGYMIMMAGRTKINLINTVATFITALTLNIFLIPQYGILGAALSLGIALSLINVIRLIEVYLILNIHPYRIDFLKPVVAGGVSLAALSMSFQYLHISHPFTYLASGVLIFASSYALLLYILRMSEEDKLILEKIKLKLGITSKK